MYEQIVKIPYYGIYVISSGNLEMYQLVHASYQKMTPNERGHYEIEPLGVELGLWQGNYQNQTQLWLRWWDKDGNLLLTGWEQTELERLRSEEEKQRADHERVEKEQEKQRADREQQRADREQQRADREQQKSEKLAARLKELGIDPDLL